MNKDEEEYRKLKNEIIQEVTKLRKKIIKLKPEYLNRLINELPEIAAICNILMLLDN